MAGWAGSAAVSPGPDPSALHADDTRKSIGWLPANSIISQRLPAHSLSSLSRPSWTPPSTPPRAVTSSPSKPSLPRHAPPLAPPRSYGTDDIHRQAAPPSSLHSPSRRNTHPAYVARVLDAYSPPPAAVSDCGAKALLQLTKDEQVLITMRGERGWLYGHILEEEGGVATRLRTGGWLPAAYVSQSGCQHCVRQDTVHLKLGKSMTESALNAWAEAELVSAVRDMDAKLQAIYAHVKEQGAAQHAGGQIDVPSSTGLNHPAHAARCVGPQMAQQQSPEVDSCSSREHVVEDAFCERREYGRAPNSKPTITEALRVGDVQPHSANGADGSGDMPVDGRSLQLPAPTSNSGLQHFFESALPLPPSPTHSTIESAVPTQGGGGNSRLSARSRSFSPRSDASGAEEAPLPSARGASYSAMSQMMQKFAAGTSTTSVAVGQTQRGDGEKEILAMRRMREEVQAEVEKGRQAVQRELQRLASAKPSGQHDRQYTDDARRDASLRDEEDRGSEPSNVRPPLAMPRSRSPKPAATQSSVLRHVAKHKQGATEATSPRVEWNLEAARLAQFRPQHEKDEASGDRPPQRHSSKTGLAYLHTHPQGVMLRDFISRPPHASPRKMEPKSSQAHTYASLTGAGQFANAHVHAVSKGV